MKKMKTKRVCGKGTAYRKIGMDRLKMYCRDALGNENKRKQRNQREIVVYLLPVNPFPPDV